MNRVLRVARVQLTDWKQAFGWPVAILALSFAINLALYWSIGDGIEGDQITGGILSIFVFQTIMCAQLMTQTFSFAVGLNVTRRTFFTAAVLMIALRSLAFSVLLYLLSIVERLSDGWGVRMIYFTVLPVTRTYSPLNILVFLVPMLVFAVAGLFFGIVGKRWGTNGVLGLTLLTILVVGGAVVLISWRQSWGDIFQWLNDQPGLALAAGWTLIPLVLLATGSYRLTRRAVP